MLSSLPCVHASEKRLAPFSSLTPFHHTHLLAQHQHLHVLCSFGAGLGHPEEHSVTDPSLPFFPEAVAVLSGSGYRWLNERLLPQLSCPRGL